MADNLEIEKRLFKDYANFTSTFEQSERDSISSKIKTKNITIGILSISCLSLSFALAVLMPLKQKVPVIIAIDNLKGTVNTLTNTNVERLNIDKNEAIDKANLANYVINREGYDWNYGEAAFNKTVLMTSKDISKEYQILFADDNPISLVKKYSNNVRVVIENPSVSFYDNSAMVRFTRKITNSNQTIKTQEMAVIAYKYVTADMSDTDRLINPLGFQVTSYRVDKDITNGSMETK